LLVRSSEFVYTKTTVISYIQYKEGRKTNKTNWIGHISRRNCLLKHVIAGKIDGKLEVTGRRRRDLSSYLRTLRNGGKKRLSSPVTGLEWPSGFQEVKVPRFHDNGTGCW
jgi:hypothetical protein